MAFKKCSKFRHIHLNDNSNCGDYSGQIKLLPKAKHFKFISCVRVFPTIESFYTHVTIKTLFDFCDKLLKSDSKRHQPIFSLKNLWSISNFCEHMIHLGLISDLNDSSHQSTIQFHSTIVHSNWTEKHSNLNEKRKKYERRRSSDFCVMNSWVENRLIFKIAAILKIAMIFLRVECILTGKNNMYCLYKGCLDHV